MDAWWMETLIWLAILVCVSQSAMFSGLNLAFFSVSRLRLEVMAAEGNVAAGRVLKLRRDSHLLLTTILWGNVAVNVLLTLLAESILAGVTAFLFSTVIITFFGEIFPQAYFSRHALKVASRVYPLFSVYRVFLYPVARPTALILDRWLGPEGINFWKERDLREMIRIHMRSEASEVERVEGMGVLNFLALDDLPASEEGEAVDPTSVLQVPFRDGLPVFPEFERRAEDPLLRQIESSGKKWVIVMDTAAEPQLVLDADAFLRAALFRSGRLNPVAYCHRPIVVRDESRPLGRVIHQLEVHPHHSADDVVDHDIILVWGRQKRIITGADLLGRLLRGIAVRVSGKPGASGPGTDSGKPG